MFSMNKVDYNRKIFCKSGLWYCSRRPSWVRSESDAYIVWRCYCSWTKHGLMMMMMGIHQSSRNRSLRCTAGHHVPAPVQSGGPSWPAHARWIDGTAFVIGGPVRDFSRPRSMEIRRPGRPRRTIDFSISVLQDWRSTGRRGSLIACDSSFRTCAHAFTLACSAQMLSVHVPFRIRYFQRS